VKNGTRLTALGGVVVAGALALSACGSDNNSGSSGSSAPAAASGDCVKATVNAAGSSAQKNAIAEWTKGYQASCAGATLNYNPSGSGAGVQAFTAGQVTFAGSDSALKPAEKPAADKRCTGGEAIDLPMVGGPISIVYNVKGVDGLQLSAKTLADIFNGKVTKWNDPEIKAENASATLPATDIKTIHRSDDSGTTDNFTKYLIATAKTDWPYTGGKTWQAKGGEGLKGSDGVSTGIKQTDGAIGYVELSFATSNSLSIAKVKNGAGEYTAASSQAASATIGGAQQTGTGNDLALKIDYATTTAGAYPITLVTYEIVCTKGVTGDPAKFVKSFLTYTASDAGQGALTNLGYAPLPAAILTKVRAAIASLS
jgi:phosphate transport system substrate-binding protein